MLVVFTAFLVWRQERVDIYCSNSDLNKKKFVFLLENLHLCMWYLAKRKVKLMRKYASLSFFLWPKQPNMTSLKSCSYRQCCSYSRCNISVERSCACKEEPKPKEPVDGSWRVWLGFFEYYSCKVEWTLGHLWKDMMRDEIPNWSRVFEILFNPINFECVVERAKFYEI